MTQIDEPGAVPGTEEAQASLRADIRSVLVANEFLEDVDLLDDESSLFEAGLNSLTAVRLALTLEDRYDLLFEDEALTRESLGSIAALGALVEVTRAAGTDACP